MISWALRPGKEENMSLHDEIRSAQIRAGEDAVIRNLERLGLAQAKPEPERFFSFEFEVWQNDMMVASASGPRDDALREAMHYAAQYEQDGPVRVFEVTRILVRPNARHESRTKGTL